MKKFVIALMVTATSAIGFAQSAGPGTPHGHGRHGAGFDRIAAKLNLTDAQKQQLKDIRTADREQNKQLYADFRAKLQELRALKQANDPKADDVKAELKAMRPQIVAARKASHEAMLNILTPEQRDQLKAARQNGIGRRMAVRRGLRAGFGNLNLSDEQKSQLKQLRETTQQQNAQLFADAHSTRQELRSLRGSNDARATELKAHLESLRPQLEAARKQQHEAFVNILTPEQRTQLEQWKAQRQSRRQSR